jgi:hypothetical protein
LSRGPWLALAGLVEAWNKHYVLVTSSLQAVSLDLVLAGTLKSVSCTPPIQRYNLKSNLNVYCHNKLMNVAIWRISLFDTVVNILKDIYCNLYVIKFKNSLVKLCSFCH